MVSKEHFVVDTIANFEKIINKNGIGLNTSIKMIPGTLAERYRGILELESPHYIRAKFYSIFIITAGNCTASIRDIVQDVIADYLLIVPENILHRLYNIKSCSGYCIHFHSEFLEQVVNGLLTSQFPYLSMDAHHIIRLTERESKLIQNCFKDIIRAYNLESRERESLMRDFLHILLLHIRAIYSSFSKSVPAAANRSAILAIRFVHFVETNFREMHSVKQYAELLHISPNHLTQVVQKALGKSPQLYIHEMLLHEAKSLLQTTDKSVTEIAYTLNFTDQAHFNHFIKKHTGTTPLKLRSSN